MPANTPESIKRANEKRKATIISRYGSLEAYEASVFAHKSKGGKAKVAKGFAKIDIHKLKLLSRKGGIASRKGNR